MNLFIWCVITKGLQSAEREGSFLTKGLFTSLAKDWKYLYPLKYLLTNSMSCILVGFVVQVRSVSPSCFDSPEFAFICCYFKHRLSESILSAWIEFESNLIYSTKPRKCLGLVIAVRSRWKKCLFFVWVFIKRKKARQVCAEWSSQGYLYTQDFSRLTRFQLVCERAPLCEPPASLQLKSVETS